MIIFVENYHETRHECGGSSAYDSIDDGHLSVSKKDLLSALQAAAIFW